MPRIVDGDNLLGTWPGRERSPAERRRVAHEIARLARHRSWRIVVVFDGSDRRVGSLGPDVRFAGRGREADEVILEVLREQRDPAGWVAVTDDRALADRCRHLGARIERCARFRERLRPGPDPEKPERVDDVDYWIEVFGGEKNRDDGV